MPRLFTVAQLVTAVQERADIVNDAHVSAALIKSWLSIYYAELYDMVVPSGIAYFECVHDFASLAGRSSYSLPGNVYAPVRMDYVLSADQLIELIEVHPREIHRLARTGGQATHYRHVQNQVVLYPTPPSAQTYRLTFIPNPVDLTSDTQTVDGVSGWEDYIITGGTIMALAKQGRTEELGVHERRQRHLQKRIIDAVQNREIANAKSLVSKKTTLYDDYDPADWRNGR